MYTFLNSVIMLLSWCQVNLLKYDLLVTCNARFYLCIWIITSRFASDITVRTVAELFTARLTEWESLLKRMLHVLFIHVLCTQKNKKKWMHREQTHTVKWKRYTFKHWPAHFVRYENKQNTKTLMNWHCFCICGNIPWSISVYGSEKWQQCSSKRDLDVVSS